MTANGRWDLFRRLKVNTRPDEYKLHLTESFSIIGNTCKILPDGTCYVIDVNYFVLCMINHSAYSVGTVN